MNKVSNFAERLNLGLQINKMSQVELSNITGISTSLINKYLKGLAFARNDKMKILADALNVSPVRLMGYEIPNKSQEPTFNELIDSIKEHMTKLGINKIEISIDKEDK